MKHSRLFCVTGMVPECNAKLTDANSSGDDVGGPVSCPEWECPSKG